MLEGKVINIDNLELLQFFYPEFIIKDEIGFRDIENKIIYTGRMRKNLKSYLEENTKDFISTVGKVDVDLSDEYKMLDFVFSKHNRKVTKKVKNSVDMMDDEDFLFCVKSYWVLGDWVYYLEDEELSMFDLFLSTIGSTINMIETYYQLLEKYPYYVVESSFFTFLKKSKEYEEMELSPGYMRLLSNFDAKSGDNLKSSVMKYMKKEDIDDRLRFLSLLLDLR